MEILIQIVKTTLNSFDFTFCLLVNVLTYTVITFITAAKHKEIKTWVKKLILFASILLTGILYWALCKNLELVINSAILAPVTWSFIFKPVFKKFGIDYKDVDDTINK